ncbi:hypothetical protein TrVE_jg419 [Triparma verrucosa]|uniref:PPM-type phosphatase domain-containing protein n=1 Tax=Triparma verrucosa TaxID=1606542 RepID=A0A9W7F7Y3_9STRA|nr:hypothetical protein TrVE_jg419 [Triparma verrucosa]
MLAQPVTEKEIHTGKHKNAAGSFEFVHASMQGWRKTMEDAHEIYCPPGASGRYVAFAVYDGHGGSDVAIKASKHAVKMITDEEPFKEYISSPNGEEEGRKQMLIASCEQGLRKADDRIRTLNQVDGEDCDESGCTANVNFLTEEFICCANVGDTRAVLCRNGEAVIMSEDHKPTNPGETIRIEKAGGRVTRKRVNGSIAVSRSLGDFFFKSTEGADPWDQPIICKPDVVVVKRDEQQDEFIVCCCDGVWDVMSNQEVCEFVRERLKAGGTNLTLISAELLNFCLTKKSKDNMTAIIVLLSAGQQLIPASCCSIS